MKIKTNLIRIYGQGGMIIPYKLSKDKKLMAEVEITLDEGAIEGLLSCVFPNSTLIFTNPEHITKFIKRISNHIATNADKIIKRGVR